ncbi:hypothetical protein ACQKMI_01505 [Lysinibacillus sp. NPDC097214]|uniref:hypothetical protein n=1 Tax=Lysinibacillus sp. NPDC097214 TaxID=3390584 RepID=UPI003D00B661
MTGRVAYVTLPIFISVNVINAMKLIDNVMNIKERRNSKMEQEVNQHTILQAILELSKQMQDMKSDLQQQIEAVEKRLEEKNEALEKRLDKVEQNLSRKIDLVDAKFDILSSDVITTKAEVSMLKQVK